MDLALRRVSSARKRYRKIISSHLGPNQNHNTIVERTRLDFLETQWRQLYNVYWYKYVHIARCNHNTMDLLLRKRFGEQFVVVSDRVPVHTPSEQFNQSFFSRFWMVYDEPEEDDLLHDDDDGWVLMANDGCTQDSTESVMVFLEGVTEKETDEYYNCGNQSKRWLDRTQAIRDLHGEKIEQYIRECELSTYFRNVNGEEVFDVGMSYTNDQNKTVVCRDWHCFLHYDADDNSEYWLININPQCALFEYVLFCGPCVPEHQFFHFSEMPDYEHLIVNHRPANGEEENGEEENSKEEDQDDPTES